MAKDPIIFAMANPIPEIMWCHCRWELYVKYQCPDRGKSTQRSVCGTGDYQWLCESLRSTSDSHDERIWGIYGVQNSGSGGEFQHEEGQGGEFYQQICTLLYPGSLLQCLGTGSVAPCGESAYGKSR